MLWWVLGIIFFVLFPLSLFYVTSRSELILDFVSGSYIWRESIDGKVTTFAGPLSDIQAVVLERVLVASRYTPDDEVWALAGAIRFAEEYTFRLNGRPCTVRGTVFGLKSTEFVRFCLDLSEKLQVPLEDSSGWQGRRGWKDPHQRDANRVVIAPGEPHPVFLLPPPKRW